MVTLTATQWDTTSKSIISGIKDQCSIISTVEKLLEWSKYSNVSPTYDWLALLKQQNILNFSGWILTNFILMMTFFSYSLPQHTYTHTHTHTHTHIHTHTHTHTHTIARFAGITITINNLFTDTRFYHNSIHKPQNQHNLVLYPAYIVEAYLWFSTSLVP